MAITAEEAEAQQLAAGHHRARLAALDWAERAETEYREALRQEEYANARQDSSYLRQEVAGARAQAGTHAVRSTEARHLAEMWARIAVALIPPPEPLELITSELGQTDG